MTYVQSQKTREGRGLAEAPSPVTPNVPTITNWQDFLTLLAVP
jgi:hypothetical protein